MEEDKKILILKEKIKSLEESDKFKEEKIKFLEEKDKMKEDSFEKISKIKEESFEKIYKIKDDSFEKINKLNEEHIKDLKNDKTESNTITKTIAKTSLQALKYANKYYSNAPNLAPIDDYSFLCNNNDNYKKFIKDLIYYKKNNTLKDYLGNIIVHKYIKSNFSEQCSWSTDPSRTNYIIKKDEWEKDNKGIEMKNKTIVPLLEFIKCIALEYMTENAKIENINEESNKEITCLGEIIKEIKDNKISENINKYVNPYFQLKKSNECYYLKYFNNLNSFFHIYL